MLKEPCNSESCRLKCTKHVSADRHKLIHQYFWKLGDLYKQRVFLLHHITEKELSRHITEKRKPNLGYFMEIDNNERTEVCKTFFLHTLRIISDRYVYTARQKIYSHGTIEGDKRGKKPNIVLQQDALDRVYNHIKSFPTIESHYLRAQTKITYYDGSLTPEMYRLYLQTCDEEGKSPVKEYKYREILIKNLILDFSSPEKTSALYATNLKH